MLKPIDPGEAIRPQREPLPAEAVNNIFKVLHGFYGNLFLSRYATGQVGQDGDDQGVVSARAVWGHGLRNFDVATVKAALGQCMERHTEYPPNLPQFAALCMANRPRVVERARPAALEMSGELRSKYVREARAALERARQKMIHKETGYVALPQSLDGLKRAIAHAVAEAGGDEAAELHRLDVMFAPRAMA